MDNKQEHLNNLSEIRSLMERSSSFISLSGLSGICAGIIGIVTAVILHSKLGPFIELGKGEVLTSEKRDELILFSILASLIALVLTFALTIFFTSRKAKKKGLPVWDGSAKRLVVNLFIPLISGGIFCLLLVYHGFDWLVLPSMLVFYGLALISASKYTLNELRWLGASELVLGLLAAFFLPQAIIFWGLGFGVMNIVYGAMMYFKHER
ncbi:MAG: hypothetical protein L0Y79_02070 [Chlorobi bacterium]|nr:hypothetical protein [Chlorobiota bacterium]MCI0716300.1 hypothetical protein [Chlorobiota bacterium]